MRFDTNPHPFYCGIDLHARSMYVCIVSPGGAILRHRHMQAAPAPFLKAMAPAREGLVGAVACLFTWYGLADRCADPDMPFVLGHALSMTALHGGTATNDTIDSPKIAVLLRGGMRPTASVYPAAMRATRDLLRRRTPLMRHRAERWSHVHTTHSPSNLPEIGKKIAAQATRAGGAARVAAPAVPTTIAVDLARIPSDDARRRDLELARWHTAQHHEATPRSLLPTVPGMGKMLRLGLLYARHRLARLPRVPAFASYGRLVTCRQASGGKRLGTSGHTIGHAHLPWAFGATAALCRRNNEPGQTSLARWEKTPDTGKALSLLAHQRARAVYSRRKRQVAGDMALLLHPSGSSTAEPEAALAPPGDEPDVSPPSVLLDCVCARYGVPRPGSPKPDAVIGQALWLLHMRRPSAPGHLGCPCPEPGPHWRAGDVQPAFCIGQEEGTASFLGRRA